MLYGVVLVWLHLLCCNVCLIVFIVLRDDKKKRRWEAWQEEGGLGIITLLATCRCGEVLAL